AAAQPGRDAGAQRARRDGNSFPQWLNALQHEGDIDRTHGQLADRRKRMALQRTKVFFRMERIAPSRLIALEVLSSGLLEGYALGGFDRRRRHAGALALDRIDAV